MAAPLAMREASCADMGHDCCGSGKCGTTEHRCCEEAGKMTMTDDRAAHSVIAEYLSVTQAERDKAKKAGNSLPDGSYPINNTHQLHSAAVLAASHHGDWKAAMALIRRRARELGVDVTTLPGFGGASKSAQHDPNFELRRRRRSNPQEWVGRAERRGMQIEMRSRPDGTGGTNFIFDGYASVFDTPFPMWDKYGDPYTEVVKPGAFTRSLQRPDLDVPFLIGHDDKRLALARTRNGTMQLSQDTHGMLVHAVLDGRRSDVRDLAYAVERGDNDEMSVGFITLGQQWSEDYETRNMLDLDIHRGDVSSVPLAAIPATAGSLISFPTETLSRSAAQARAAGGMNEAADWDGDADGGADNHLPFTGRHEHPHPAYGVTPAGQPHSHLHDHEGDSNHKHGHSAAVTGRSAGAPSEYLGNPVEQGLGDASDFTPSGMTKCVNGKCAHQNDGQPPGAKFCNYCGDALVRLNADGVPGMEEEQGAAASLAQRRRQLEFLRLSHRTEVA